MKYKVTVYCDGIIGSDIHCNKYLTVKVDDKDSIDERIEKEGWEVMDEHILCDNEECRIPNYKK